MGNDGGSIPTRRELVKEAARNPNTTQLKESIQEQQEYAWNIDPLSQQTLSSPVVSDFWGRLFNKDSMIEHLLPASDENAITRRLEREQILKGAIKSLRDIVEVKFEIDASAPPVSKKDKNGILRTEKWICPITNKELGPGTKTVYLVPCGHAFSEVAIKEITERKCLKCNEEYVLNDIIPILAVSKADTSRLQLRMQNLNETGLTHSLKRVHGLSKKRKKSKTESPLTSIEKDECTEGTTKKIHREDSFKQARISSGGIGGIRNAGTAMLTAKVLEEQEVRRNRQKLDQNENLRSLFLKKSENTRGPQKEDDIKFMNRGYAIQHNS